MHASTVFVLSAALTGFFAGVPLAGNYKADTTAGGMKIELHISPAERIFTKKQASSGKEKEGMVVVRGAEPLSAGAGQKPNRHLFITIFDSLTAMPVSNAKVKMTFQPLNELGDPTGGPIDVPIVEMQAMGMGESSSHYGNNVVMQNNPYMVDIEVNGSRLKFKIGRLFGPASTVEPEPPPYHQ